MIPIDCKMLIFPYNFLHNSYSYELVENPFDIALCIHTDFQPITQCYNTKCFSKINPAITKNKCLVILAHAPVIDLKVGVSLNYTLLHQCAPHFQSHNACTANRYLHGEGEKNGAQRRTKGELW